ncbi:MAG: hypothetical protein KatS3mg070_2100 [Meiothermus sp.]|uniref:hypothetical protein n=1 Tax=Meiothermus sp. TaxID=1955249 RepID=UPI0021DCAD14|nr:hypothetical protein [Meiothermus sp.]GIW28737.1 MAG: hypothetical protein KatS3mg070_2100 [Meiothermus sp.]
MELPTSKVSYKLVPGPTRPQTEADISFRGGVPRMPAELELPRCQRCGDEQTFFFQVAFPEKHLWHGWVMCVFSCSSCFDKYDPSPRGHYTAPDVLPDGYLDRLETDYRIILYPADSPTARMRTEARQLLKFEEIRFEKLRVNNRHYETKLGGKPFWIDDPRPIEEIEYMGGHFVFIGQFMEEFNFFPALEDAPPPKASGQWIRTKPVKAYGLFHVGGNFLFFGTTSPRVIPPRVLIVPTK